MTMIEKIALALLNDEREWSGASKKMTRLEDLLDPKEPEFRRRQARAAIAAMREPTQEMLNAAVVTPKWEMSDSGEIWQAMIDAALKESDQVVREAKISDSSA